MSPVQPSVTLLSIEPNRIFSSAIGNSRFGQVADPIQHIRIDSHGENAKIILKDKILPEGDTIFYDDAMEGSYSIDNLSGYRLSAAFAYLTNTGNTTVTVSGKQIPADTTVLFLRKPEGTYGLLMISPMDIQCAVTNVS